MSWSKVKLGDFLRVRDNRYKPSDKAIANLQRIDKIDFSGEIYISNKPSNTDMILVKKGDLVISGINVEKGAMAVYTGDNDLTATIHYSSYSFDENKIDIEFLKSFLKSSEFKNALKEQVPGGIKTEIKPKHLLPLEVFIPTDIREQRKVVNRLSALNIKIESVSQEISYQKDLLKKLRQQLLQDAVQGKLVKQDKKEGHAKDLLEKIKAEKAKLISEKKIKKEKDLPPIKPEEIPFEIPESWVWCRLGELREFKYSLSYGVLVPGNHVPNGVPFIRVQDLDYASSNVIPSRCISEALSKQFGKTILVGGEILICVVGSIGKVALSSDSWKGANIARAVCRYMPNRFLSREYLYFCLNSPFVQNYFQKGKKSINPTLNVNILESTILPIPPFAEQIRIVKKVQELMVQCDELDTNILESEAQTEKLLQQVLREALQEKEV